jgi:hypothetical protein
MAKLRHVGTGIGCMALLAAEDDERISQSPLGAALVKQLDDVLHAHVFVESLVAQLAEDDANFNQQHTKKAFHRAMAKLTCEP